MYQIINNIVSNAVNAIDKKGSISIQLQEEGTHRMITVEDTGKGMSRKTADKAFDAFYTTRETNGGSGLGLFLVKRLAASLDWQVNISSKKDTGTCVTLNWS